MPRLTPTAQTPAQRRAVEAQLKELIARFAPDLARQTALIRGRLRTLLPNAFELVYEYRDAAVISYSPTDHGHEGLLALRLSADGLQLYFNQGKSLPDPEGILQGKGKQTRWIPLPTASALGQPAVKALIEHALGPSRGKIDEAAKRPKSSRSQPKTARLTAKTRPASKKGSRKSR